MTIHETTDEPNQTPIPPDDPSEETVGIVQEIREWLAVPAHITRGWLLLTVIFAFVFLACAVWAAVGTVNLDNRVTKEQVADSIAAQITSCKATNVIRENAKIIAEEALAADQSSLDRDLAALHNDEANWDSLDDLFPQGIPEPAKTTIFDGLAAREEVIRQQQEKLTMREVRIANTYLPTDCSLIADVVTSSDTDN